MTRIMITLSEEENKALLILAIREFRDPRDQALLIVRKKLEGLGLIGSANSPQDKNLKNGPAKLQPVEKKTSGRPGPEVE